MPRALRTEYEGAIYHVMNRGDRREPIYLGDADRVLFLDTLTEACAKTDWQVHAFCLMNNHFHLVIETPHANLVYGMKWLLGTYTLRFNRRHQVTGHLFGGRYKALIIGGSSPGYLRTACDYVHLNPIRAGLIKTSSPLRTFVWSSFPEYLKAPSRRQPWLRVDRLLSECGCEDCPSGRRAFEQYLESRRLERVPNNEWSVLCRGWFMGSENMRKELLARRADEVGQHHYGSERQEGGRYKAERLIMEELAHLGWTEASLTSCRKGDPRKVKIARRLRAETTVTLAWIAERLHMGAWTHVSNLLQKCR